MSKTCLKEVATGEKDFYIFIKNIFIKFCVLCLALHYEVIQTQMFSW